jgi:hypothetical protein
MNYKKEHLENKSLFELLDIYTTLITKTPESFGQKDSAKTVYDFIIQNFTEKPTVELRKAYDAVDAMNLPNKVKDTIKQVKYCAFDIAQHLDPMDVSSMAMLKKILEERISVAESVIKNIE